MAPTTDPAELLLPEGTRLVHIGPPKTGTTSLQGAFHASRDALLAQGVRYAGKAQHSRRTAYAAIQRPAYGHLPEPPPIRLWQELVAEIRGAPEPRVVLSSEILADGDAAAARRVVDDLDPARVHVAITLRPLPRLLASQWQQGIRGGMQTSFDTWLRGVFAGEGSAAQRFWHRHRHDELVARWAELVGTEHVTVVVVDDRDHGMILRAFERLLGLREGTLEAPHDRTNRSMTLPEVEAVRAFNVAFKRAGLDAALLHRVGPWSTPMTSRTPGPDEPRIETPQWALDRAAEIAREMVPNIAASGVRVVGDLESLTAVARSGIAGDHLPAVAIPPEVAASMAMGVLIGTGLVREAARTPGGGTRLVEARGRPGARDLDDVTTPRLVATLLDRGPITVRRGIRAVRRRLA